MPETRPVTQAQTASGRTATDAPAWFRTVAFGLAFVALAIAADVIGAPDDPKQAAVKPTYPAIAQAATLPTHTAAAAARPAAPP